MTNFFNTKPHDDGGKHHRALNTVQTWLNGRRHLPKDLVEALHRLIPELREGAEDYED